jgi:antitoxin component YwqK of YwqJK toxin-antitoxin module
LLEKTFILFAFIFIIGFSTEDSNYEKTYHDNGKVKSEGWVRYNVQIGYWRFYHNTGRVASQGHYEYGKKEKYWSFYDTNRVRTQEGHFINNKKVNWWLFYDKQGRINHKFQLNKEVKNGYCLKYIDNELTSAEKYSNGKTIKEWTSFGDYKKENSVSDRI